MESFDREATAATLLARVNNIAHKYARDYPDFFDRQEAEGLAGLALAIALTLYNPELGRIEPLVDTIVRRTIMQEVRTIYRRRKIEDVYRHVQGFSSDDFERIRHGVMVDRVREPADDEDVESYLITLENHAAIIRGVERISDEDLELIRLRSSGKTYEQIGQAAGMRKQSAHERIAKARKTILAELEAVR
jgi:DNA-directed RNA polymerase specialized sigma24 family protein